MLLPDLMEELKEDLLTAYIAIKEIHGLKCDKLVLIGGEK